jgi:hypothetical protein
MKPSCWVAAPLLALSCSSQVREPASTSPSMSTSTSTSVHADDQPPDAGVAEPSGPAPSEEQWKACRRRHCYETPDSRACFGRCYKYGHLRSDKTEHANCDESCRAGLHLDECDRACAADRRAFASFFPDTTAGCVFKMKACRKRCSEPRNVCELDCLRELAACDERAKSD